MSKCGSDRISMSGMWDDKGNVCNFAWRFFRSMAAPSVFLCNDSLRGMVLHLEIYFAERYENSLSDACDYVCCDAWILYLQDDSLLPGRTSNELLLWLLSEQDLKHFWKSCNKIIDMIYFGNQRKGGKIPWKKTEMILFQKK